MYGAIKEVKKSIPRQSSDNGELYAVSLNAVSNKSEKQQQQIPLIEYAEIDNSANQSPQHLNLPSGYNVINDNNINVNTELQVHKCTKLLMYLSKIRTYIHRALLHTYIPRVGVVTFKKHISYFQEK